MTTTAAYTMDGFIDDVKEIFANVSDPKAQAEAVSSHLKDLLAVSGWLEERLDLPEEGGYGRVDLHLEENSGHPGPGWLLMCSVQRPGQDNLPHDHGAAWVVYGVYDGAIEQTKWRWYFPGEGVDEATIKETGRFTQKNGTVAYFLPGEIHNTRNVIGTEGRSLVVRLESQKLDRVTRYQYNPADNSMRVMDR